VRVLAYDNALKIRAGERVVIALLWRGAPGDDAGAAARRAAFTQLAALTVQGLPMSVTDVSYTDATALRTIIQTQGIDVMFIDAALTDVVPAIVQVSRELKVATLASDLGVVKAGARWVRSTIRPPANPA